MSAASIPQGRRYPRYDEQREPGWPLVRQSRERVSGVPFAEHPWDEIIPRLWMGGHDYTVAGDALLPVVVADQFDLVISLFQRPGHGPFPGVEHLALDIPDGRLDDEQLDAVIRLADRAAKATCFGQQVLVRCQAGYNRSGLVVAYALVALGYAPTQAIDLIRRRRSSWALHNEAFVGYLLKGYSDATASG